MRKLEDGDGDDAVAQSKKASEIPDKASLSHARLFAEGGVTLLNFIFGLETGLCWLRFGVGCSLLAHAPPERLMDSWKKTLLDQATGLAKAKTSSQEEYGVSWPKASTILNREHEPENHTAEVSR